MTTRVINYFSCSNPSGSLHKESDLVDSRFVYTQCPVWGHKVDRTFVCLSPFDYSVKVDRKNRKIITDDPDAIQYEDDESPSPVIQMQDPQFLFWTNDDNIWFEMRDHPMTSYTNNFIAVGGWFNLSNWSRITSVGMTIVDEDKEVVIKKGDPLFKISFYSSDLNDSFVLKEETDPSFRKEYHKIEDNRDWSYDRLFKSTTPKSKCPFSWMWNRTP